MSARRKLKAPLVSPWLERSPDVYRRDWQRPNDGEAARVVFAPSQNDGGQPWLWMAWARTASTASATGRALGVTAAQEQADAALAEVMGSSPPPTR